MDELRALRILQLLVANDDYVSKRFDHMKGNEDEIEFAKELLSSCAFRGCVAGDSHVACYFNKYGKIYELLIDPDLVICVSYVDEGNSNKYLEYYNEFRKSVNTSTCAFEEFVNIILHSSNVKSARN